MRTRRLALVVSLAASACATSPARAPVVAPPPAAPPVASAPAAPAPAPLPATGLELAVRPAEAVVLVDGVARGTVGELREGVLPLASGIYQVSLRAPGFVTWRAEVAVRGGRERIDVQLEKKVEPAR